MSIASAKSASYVRPTVREDNVRIGILFLVEAALGDMHIITRYESATYN